MTDPTPAPWYRRTHWRILAALVVGLVYGVMAALAGWSEFTADWITPFGTIFLRLLLLIAVPLVLGSLITGVASLADLRKLSRIGSRTIAIYLATTFVALVIGLALVNTIRPGASIPEDVRFRLQEQYESDVEARQETAAEVAERSPLQPPRRHGARERPLRGDAEPRDAERRLPGLPARGRPAAPCRAHRPNPFSICSPASTRPSSRSSR